MSPSPVATAHATHPAQEAQVANDYVPGPDYFAVPRLPFGIATVRLSVGPLNFTLTGLSPVQHQILSDRYRAFLSDPAIDGPADLTVRFARAGVDAFLAWPRGVPENYRMGRRASETLVELWSYEFAGAIKAAERGAELFLLQETGADFERGCENFLRVMTAHFILEHGGLLVHGAGVVRDGAAYVFFGPSGVGKTTVTRMSPDDVVLSDDLTLIVHERGGYVACGIPFGLAHHRVPDTRGSFPVAGLFRLVQSQDVRRDRLDGAQALAELAGSLPFVMEDGNSAARALGAGMSLIRATPAYRLHFRREPSFWAAVQEG